MQAYKFSWNGKMKIISALNKDDARSRFEEQVGFWPSEELVSIDISPVRPLG